MASIRPLFSRSLGLAVGFGLVVVTGACTDPGVPPPTTTVPPVAVDCALRGPGVDLHGCDLSNQNLAEEDLTNANLKGADLIETDLSEVDIEDADMAGATLSATICPDASTVSSPATCAAL